MKKLLFFIFSILLLLSLNAETAGRGTAGKTITKIFNEASGAAKKVDPPPQIKHEYNTPKIKPDAEKVSIEDWRKLHNKPKINAPKP